jgi:hypothetical protein
MSDAYPCGSHATLRCHTMGIHAAVHLLPTRNRDPPDWVRFHAAYLGFIAV